MTDEQYQATPKHVLEHQIMSPGEGKNEREWWACHEIEKLRARIAQLKAALKPFADVDVSNCADGRVCYFWGFGENAGKVSAAEVRAARAAYLGEKE
jgi:hypothetical protein